MDKMRKKICVYTCITGDYDDLHEVEKPEDGVDYYCFTNNKDLESKTWKIVQIKNCGLDNQRLSRKIKMLGEPLIMKNYEVSVWMDASVVWNMSVIDFVDKYLSDGAFAAFVHSQRSSVRNEAIACLRLRKDSKEKIEETLRFLDSEGFRDDMGLFEMTVFVKKHHDKLVQKTMEVWFETLQRYSKRDQLSFPYAIWKTELQIKPIMLSVWDNEWFVTKKHSGRGVVKDCHLFYGDSDSSFSFDKYHVVNYTKKDGYYIISDIVPVDTKRIEVNPTNLVGTNFVDVKFSPKEAEIELVGLFNYKNRRVFCGGCNTVIITGNFKRGQKIEFAIKLHGLEGSEIVDFMEQAWQKEIRIAQENSQLKARIVQLESAEQRLNEIRSNKLWKIASKTKRLLR